MCGVPYHAAENYIARLIRAGHKVAICEQMEEPGPGKKLVRREVIRVLTPGTATGASLIEPKENNFLAAVARSAAANAATAGGRTQGRAADARIGLAFVDLSTGDFRATEFTGDKAEARLRDELGILRPREILVPQPTTLFPAAAPAHLNGSGAVETRLDDWIFESSYAVRQLQEHFRVVALDGFGLAAHPQATAAAGAIVHYLRETSAIGARKPEDTSAIPSLRPAGAGLEHLDRIAYYEQQDAMILDQVTARNLELVEPAPGDDASATLVRAIDETATSMGARLLRSWILRPEISLAEIEERLEAVAESEIADRGARGDSARARRNSRSRAADEPHHAGRRHAARSAGAARLARNHPAAARVDRRCNRLARCKGRKTARKIGRASRADGRACRRIATRSLAALPTIHPPCRTSPA